MDRYKVPENFENEVAIINVLKEININLGKIAKCLECTEIELKCQDAIMDDESNEKALKTCDKFFQKWNK